MLSSSKLVARVGMFAVLWLALLIGSALGQGLLPSREPAAATTTTQKLLRHYAQLKQRTAVWQRKWSATSCKARSRGRAALCASGLSGDKAEDTQILPVVASPQVYDSRNRKHTGGYIAVGPVKDQRECSTCTAFTILAAAQSAVASALRQHAESSLSEKDFHFCKAAKILNLELNLEPSCSTGMTMEDGLKVWLATHTALLQGRDQVATDECVASSPGGAAAEFRGCAGLGSFDAAALGLAPCSYTCRDTLKSLSDGTFKHKPLVGFAEVQEYIRAHGGVVTGMQVDLADMRAFFSKTKTGVYHGKIRPAQNAHDDIYEGPKTS